MEPRLSLLLLFSSVFSSGVWRATGVGEGGRLGAEGRAVCGGVAGAGGGCWVGIRVLGIGIGNLVD